MHRLRRRRRSAHEVRVGLALGHILGGSKAQDRALALSGIVADRQQFEGGERADDEIDLVALDQFLRLCLGAGRVAAGVGNDQFGRAPGKPVAAMLEKQRNPLFHLDAALRQRTGLDRQQPDPDRLLLADRRQRQVRSKRRRGTAREHSASSRSQRHFPFPFIRDSRTRRLSRISPVVAVGGTWRRSAPNPGSPRVCHGCRGWAAHSHAPRQGGIRADTRPGSASAGRRVP